MVFSLRFGFLENLANHFLNASGFTLFLFLQKPLIEICVNALLENRHASTPTTLLSQKNKRNSETML